MKSKFFELLDKNVIVDGEKIAKIKDLIIDTDEWKITHLEIELNRRASKQIVGANKIVRNTLAISALEKGMACCTDAGIEIKVSKGQLPIYLRSA